MRTEELIFPSSTRTKRRRPSVVLTPAVRWVRIRITRWRIAVLNCESRLVVGGDASGCGASQLFGNDDPERDDLGGGGPHFAGTKVGLDRAVRDCWW